MRQLPARLNQGQPLSDFQVHHLAQDLGAKATNRRRQSSAEGQGGGGRTKDEESAEEQQEEGGPRCRALALQKGTELE